MLQLDPRRRRVLEALVRRIAPPHADGARVASAAAMVRERVARLDARSQRRFMAALRILDSRAAVLACIGRARPFIALTAAQQDLVLRSWERSHVAWRRTLFQALRRLVLAAWYGEARSLDEIGWPGPLHQRGLRFRWEGPMPADADAGPIARGDRTSPLSDPRSTSQRAAPSGVLRGHDYIDGQLVRADVCVIGSGAGGSVAAARLAEAGFEVLLVEEGSWLAGADFNESESELIPRLYADAGTRATEDLGVAILQGRCAGGSSTINWLVMLRAAESVIDEWERDYGAYRFSPAAMSAAYALIERETSTTRVPDEAHSPNNRVILEGARALGWRAWPSSVNARDCVRAGSCGVGCRWGAKQGALGVYLPRALAAGARIACDLRADRLEVAERAGRAPRKRIVCSALDPRSGDVTACVTIEAPLVVLAGGAIGTPALLLRSGLGTAAVGRYLRLHPTSAVIGVFDQAIYGGSGIPLSVVCDEFLDRDPHGHGFWIEAPPLSPVLAAAALPGFGAEHAGIMSLYPRLSGTIVLVRDGAARTPGGRVRVRRDGSSCIDYQLSVPDRRHLLDGLGAAARIVLAAGAREAYTLHTPPLVVRTRDDVARIPELPSAANQLTVLSAHVMGTCRAGGDGARSACTPDGELRSAAGCYVADGSLMPTAPGVNPQETIMALASIVASGIIDRHRSGLSTAIAHAAG